MPWKYCVTLQIWLCTLQESSYKFIIIDHTTLIMIMDFESIWKFFLWEIYVELAQDLAEFIMTDHSNGIAVNGTEFPPHFFPVFEHTPPQTTLSSIWIWLISLWKMSRNKKRLFKWESMLEYISNLVNSRWKKMRLKYSISLARDNKFCEFHYDLPWLFGSHML